MYGPWAALVMSKDSFSSVSGSATGTPCVPRTESALSFFDPHTAPWPVRPACRPSLVTLANSTSFSPATADRGRAHLVIVQFLADGLLGLEGVLAQQAGARVRNSTRSSSINTLDPLRAGPVDDDAIPPGALEGDRRTSFPRGCRR